MEQRPELEVTIISERKRETKGHTKDIGNTKYYFYFFRRMHLIEPGVSFGPKTVDFLQDLQRDQGTYIS
jgi:hypothetical protein